MCSYYSEKFTEDFIKRMYLRSRIVDLIRGFFKNKGFLEVETPILVKSPGMEPYLDPFSTYVYDVKAKKYKAYLITSPEYSMKKLIAGGFDKIFQITKSFRNRECFGGLHNPEFTLLEWYQVGIDYNDLILQTIDLLKFICKKLFKSTKFSYQGYNIDLEDYKVYTVKQVFKDFIGLDLDELLNKKKMQEVFCKFYDCSIEMSWDDMFYKFILDKVEPNLPKDKLIVLKDFPFYQASLARLKTDNKNYAERFEIFISGIELCNGFSELTDYKEQERRLKLERRVRKDLGKEVYDIDLDFIQALKSGLPDCAGNALGVDRLVMLFTNAKTIQDVLFFPAEDIFNK